MDDQRIAVLMKSSRRWGLSLLVAAVTAGTGTMAPGDLRAEKQGAIPQDPSRLLIVDCLLPGQVRKLGGQVTYLSPRRPARTTASDCEIRGGEYVAYDRANYGTALSVWLPQAEAGDAQAQAYVGEIYEKGLGRPADYAEAAKWYEKAAAQDYKRAQMYLAYLYEQGLGVARDPVKALNLYRQASGITDDSLSYTSELTAVRTELQGRIDELTAQLEQQNGEIERLAGELEARQSQIASQRTALAQAQGDAARMRGDLARLQAQAGVDPAKVAELKRLETELRNREQKLLQDERAVASLEAESAEQRARLADQLQAAAEKDFALREQLQDTAAAKDQLQQQLVATQRRLLETEQKSARLRADLASAQASISKERELLARNAATAAPDQAKYARAQADLAERERLLAAQQKQIATLLGQQRAYTAEVTRLRAEQQASAKSAQQSANQVSTQQALASVRSELASTKRRLVETEQRAADLAAELQTERTRIAVERERINRQAKSATVAQEQELARLRQDLASREADTVRQQMLISSLQSESRLYRQKIQEMQSAPVERVALRGTGSAAAAGPALPATSLPKELKRGTYYALLIGNNSYQDMEKLQTAVADALAVDEVLRKRYGFKTRVLVDATRADILQALNDYRQMLKPDDSLLIYYAGHGALDRQNAQGYWLPVNAQRNSTVEWISGQQVTDQINLMAARHVLVVADSCYQGFMTRDANVGFPPAAGDAAQIKRLTRLAMFKSRTVLTSGGDQPVIDSGGGGTHSIFAQVLLRVLRENDRVLEGEALHNALFDDVKRAAERLRQDQRPRYAVLADAEHGNGDFLFIPLS